MRIVCGIVGVVSLLAFCVSVPMLLLTQYSGRPLRAGLLTLLGYFLRSPVEWLMVFSIMCATYILVDIRDKLASNK